MATIFCDSPINPCLDPTIPTANYSSEAPDRDTFIGNNWDWNGGNPPPLRPRWFSAGCGTICISEISQEDADLCAARANAMCVDDQCEGDECPQLFFSNAKSCTRTCPDGLPFTYVVAAGQFAGLWNQETVDAIAFSYACRQAELKRLCMGSITDQCCANVAYSSRVAITPQGRTVSARIVSGELPDGLTLTEDDLSFTVSGTPTVPGLFEFTIRVEDEDGNFMQKPYSICVIDIRWDSEPFGTPMEDAVLGENYQITFSAISCAEAPLNWQVTSGSLPPGMTLDEETGVLSGTPQELGDFTFIVQLQTAAT